MMKLENRGNFLDLIPDRNCQWDKTGDGRTYLLVPRFKNQWMKKIALRLGKSEFVKVYFDDNGDRVWGLIDGSKSVEEIGKLMEKEKGKDETPQQVYDRLTEFMSILARNNFIRFKLEKQNK
jgi:predicted RNA-binding protein (virulence factor B family)